MTAKQRKTYTADQQINIAISEFLGWKQCRWNPAYGCLRGVPPGQLEFESIPNYARDLNALHKVWVGLTPAQHQVYRERLRQVSMVDGHIEGPCRSLSNANATQRCEALIRMFTETSPRKK